MKTLRQTDWEAVQRHAEAAKKAQEFWAQHPLTRSEAAAQVQRLHEMPSQPKREVGRKDDE